MKVRFLLISIVALFAVGILSTSSYAKIDPKTCVGMWLFDDGNGKIAKDSSGNNNDGTLVKEPKWVDGKLGKALEFSGTNYVDVGNAASLDITSAITVAAWVNSKDGTYALCYAAKDDYGAQRSWYFGMNNATSFKVCMWTTAGRKDVIMDGFNLNEWTHVAFTYDGANVYLYKNGVRSNPTPHTGKLLSYPSVKVTLGTLCDRDLFFKGPIDDVAILNVALGQEDIQTIINKGLKQSVSPAAVDLSGKLTTTWANIKAR